MVIIIWVTFVAGVYGMENLTLKEITAKLPTQVQGWQKSTEAAVYSAKNLFKYINGGAELYISYEFKELAALTYRKQGDAEIKVDIFDMGSSASAYGVFSHSKEGVDRFVSGNVESEYASGLLTFWKGRYYISILAYPETDAKRDVLQKLGRFIADLIDEESKKPAILGLLPRQNLLPHSIRYFRHYIWLNSHFFVSNDNILNINNNIEAVLAKYAVEGKGGGKAILLLVYYPDESGARAAQASFLKQYLPESKNGFKLQKDGKWTGFLLKGRLLAIVFNAAAEQHARDLLAKINYKNQII